MEEDNRGLFEIPFPIIHQESTAKTTKFSVTSLKFCPSTSQIKCSDNTVR